MVRLFFLLAFIFPSLAFSQSLIQGDLVLTPIVDGIEPYQFVQDFRIQYTDSGRCTDESFVELITEGGYVSLKPIKFSVSCKIVSWGRIASDKDRYILLNYPLILVRVQNPQSENIFYYKIEDTDKIRSILKKY
jgi:hypothetical protein